MEVRDLFNGNGRKERRIAKAKELLTLWRGKVNERKAATQPLYDQLAKLEEPLLAYEAMLEMEIDKLVSEIGTSVVSDGAKAQYRKEHVRTSWNNQNLVGYAAEHPEILQFRTVKTIAANVSLRLT